ncbi:MAG: N-6 DNA methylase [Bacteroidales bacterium]|nr:N-6 DNA methylase [Bacteroidales bacterium]
MLDNITKKNIDDCRDVLVGKVPDPKSQIEQITLALIYKFMDDMDKEAVEKFKGKAKFFTGEYAKYGWRKLFDPSLNGQDMLSLYSEALEKLNTNPNIPELFRNIFKNAYLPYRDPATLKLFLKHINEFEYSHSEKLGDAFEYLLSVMGSQGDAGQFRTPRHIIDFVTACVNPQKNESVLDPACGTAGFLLSAYKHILNQNTEKRLGDKLKPDDRKKLATNFVGYDISPDMVRLSLANMYLHGFATPQIHEYDTLSSEDRWQETFDVILANPPFMTPKGGIRPHKKFGVQANKAEVLFTDYIAEHLNPKGRAGIIVPEGILFHPSNAFKQLRKLLLEDSLIAIISLPAGVFNPYSGVKTSILVLDKALAKSTKEILFIKIENDGFDLGSQRKKIDLNDLPHALNLLNKFKEHIKECKPTDSLNNENYSVLTKNTILSNTGFILNMDRYKENKNTNSSQYPMVKIGEICEIQRGGSPRPIDDYITTSEDGINWIKIGDVSENAKYVLSTKEKIKKEGLKKTRLVYEGDFILSNSMSFGRPYIVKITGAIHDGWLLLRMKNPEIIDQDYLYEILRSDLIKEQYEKLATGGVVRNLNSNLVSSVEIPLPPIEIQREIVNRIRIIQEDIEALEQSIEDKRTEIKESISDVWGVKDEIEAWS